MCNHYTGFLKSRRLLTLGDFTLTSRVCTMCKIFKLLMYVCGRKYLRIKLKILKQAVLIIEINITPTHIICALHTRLCYLVQRGIV